MARILLIGTWDTKAEELGYLAEALARHDLGVRRIDVSLGSAETQLPGAEKLERMAERARVAMSEIARDCGDCVAAIGVGGGTGGEIALAAMKGLPATFPKLLVTTMAFDPRAALADTAVTLVPTLCDIEGLNAPLRQVFENAGAMVSALARVEMVEPPSKPVVAVTTLGATGRAGTEVAQALGASGFESTVFHANGYGGAAFSRFVDDGNAAAIIDLNTHELGRIRLAGAHVPMPRRFICGVDVPRVVLPGALNFIGLGAIETVPERYLTRSHYRHSNQFTHVKLTSEEMEAQAEALADALNESCAQCRVLIPMGGFSHEDRPGGAIEDAALREVAAQTLENRAQAYEVTRMPHHINTRETAHAAVAALCDAIMADTKGRMTHG